MLRFICSVFLVGIIIYVCMVTTLAEETGVSFSKDRVIGLGLSTPCIFSARWNINRFAYELNAFAYINDWDYRGEVYGCFSLKLLYTVGKYRSNQTAFAGVWIEVPFGPHPPFWRICFCNCPGSRFPPTQVALVLGSEENRGPNLAINVEVGVQAPLLSPKPLSKTISYVMGIGFHYYVLKPAPDEHK